MRGQSSHGSSTLNCGTSRRRLAVWLRALALLGRLPSAHVDGDVMQASEKPAHERQNSLVSISSPNSVG
jgi:hypothetical protein